MDALCRRLCKSLSHLVPFVSDSNISLSRGVGVGFRATM
jgi:hypothetical protein